MKVVFLFSSHRIHTQSRFVYVELVTILALVAACVLEVIERVVKVTLLDSAFELPVEIGAAVTIAININATSKTRLALDRLAILGFSSTEADIVDDGCSLADGGCDGGEEALWWASSGNEFVDVRRTTILAEPQGTENHRQVYSCAPRNWNSISTPQFRSEAERSHRSLTSDSAEGQR
ncbi:beta-glucosidase [Pseudozyma hubeiensis SY62]|uniref:Beta-glucosidase n=1 Tax=Pseudozyma hubeiensis (strain SY62) TaxID=1305764 RepID=R9P8C9_PSEHS|nr:beta-glucosidase [Pseudozyma hubeiensis SY62]GAC94315.1 beta-glucosidase [Pseudozyma hubeiensis SY62]